MNTKQLLRLIWGSIIGVILLIQNGLAQIPTNPVNVQSPNAASLGLFGKIPVSYFTGVPNISVPLYTLQQNRTSIPISLSYHASGVRPDMHPGWVGMGWSLASGGVISRVIKDEADDYSNSYIQRYQAGFYYNHGILNNSSWNTIPYMQSVTRSVEANKDTEPDEFSFNFGGYSGNFYMNADGTWKVRCEKPLKIAMNGSFLDLPFFAPQGTSMWTYGSSKTFEGFVVTTEDGTKYYFGGNTNAIEYSIAFFNQETEEWRADSWYLTKVVSPDGDQINLDYERDSFINQMYISVLHDLGTNTVNSGGSLVHYNCSGYSTSGVRFNYDGKLVAPVYLKKITGSQSVIKFIRSTSTELRYFPDTYAAKYTSWMQINAGNTEKKFLPILANENPSYDYPQILDLLQWKKLDAIQIEKTDGSVIKKFNFTYTNDATKRLTLLSLTEQGSDLASNPPYQFSYDQSKSLPDYLSNEVDHWGFYNGTYADVTNATTYFTYREPVAAYLYAGTLNKITYPTGGVTEFTYEPHQYSKRIQEIRANGIDVPFHTNTPAGGLRIQKIVSYDPQIPLQKIEKQYYYLESYTNGATPSSLFSSGVLGGQTKYYFLDYRRRAFNDNDVIYSKSLFSSQSVLPGCANAMGSHIGYTEVIEKINDGSYTRYTYSNFDNGRNDAAADNLLQSSRTAYEPYSSTEEERGKLIKEEKFNASDQKVSQKDIRYLAFDKANQYVPALKANFSFVCQGSGIAVEEGTAYRLYTYSYIPDKETTTIYDAGGLNGVTTVKDLAYTNPDKLLKSEALTNSKGGTITTAYKYPGDMLSADPTGVFNDMYTNWHIVSPVIEKTTTYPGSQSEYERTDYFKPFTGVYVPRTIYSGPTIATAEPRFWFHYYDSNGNVLSTAREKGPTASYIWGYNKQYPITSTTNGDMKEVYHQNFEEPELGLDFEANVIYDNSRSHTGKYSGRIINPNATEMVSHSSKRLNVSLAAAKKFTFSGWVYSTGPTVQLFLFMMKAGETGYNTYNDSMLTAVTGKWVYMKKEFLVPADVVQMFLRLDNNSVGTVWFDDLRIQPSDAAMSTYTYEPLVGMTSEIDDSGKTVYYEYDTFQRLMHVKDLNGNILKKYNYHFKL